MLSRRIHEPLHIVGEHDVVSTHDGDQLVLHECQALAVVRVRAQVGFITHVGDALILQRLEPAGNRVVWVAVINNNQAPVRVGLADHRQHSLLHHGDVAVVGEQNINGHKVLLQVKGVKNTKRKLWFLLLAPCRGSTA